jgi:hypothetical protein
MKEIKDRYWYIGKRCILVEKSGDFRVQAKILNARDSYGRIDVKVTPMWGSGSKWVNSDRVVVLGENYEEEQHG